MKKILIVDDIEDYILQLSGILEDEYEVLEALTKEDALQIIKENEPDYAIIDVRLDEDDPDNKEGLELLKWIQDEKPHIQVIIMSGYKEFDFAVNALNLGAEYFLKKPVSPEELYNCIKELED